MLEALDLAGIEPGTRFLDLGCGDGRVLIEAAKRGASVRGIDIDPEMAEVARALLEEVGIPGTVEVADIAVADLCADVIYAYLSPVMLSGLPALLAHSAPGTRVVTPNYRIAGWQPSRESGDASLYVLPPVPSVPPEQRGWPGRAALVVMPDSRRILISVTFNADPGPLDLEIEPMLARAARYAIGERLDRPAPVPIDFIFEPHGAGSVVAGSLRAQGKEMTLAAVFAKGGHGHWTFGPRRGLEFRDMLTQATTRARQGA
jgi:SAM-dependent methyltransferase